MAHSEDRDGTDLLGTLIRVAGRCDTLALVEMFGGQRLYIPAHISEKSRIRQAVSTIAADALSAEFAGMTLKVPLAKQWRIAVYRERGMSYAAIASACGCSETTVWRQVREMGFVAERTGESAAPSLAISGSRGFFQ